MRRNSETGIKDIENSKEMFTSDVHVIFTLNLVGVERKGSNYNVLYKKMFGYKRLLIVIGLSEPHKGCNCKDIRDGDCKYIDVLTTDHVIWRTMSGQSEYLLRSRTYNSIDQIAHGIDFQIFRMIDHVTHNPDEHNVSESKSQWQG